MRTNHLWIGSGYPTDGWVTVDINRELNPHFVLDMDFSKLPFADNTFDDVFSWHFLEHLHWTGIINTLKEIYRVAKPNATVHIGVPNALWCLHNPDVTEAVYNMNGTGGFGEDHHFFFTPTSLKEIFESFGFKQIKWNYNDILLHQYPENSLEAFFEVV